MITVAPVALIIRTLLIQNNLVRRPGSTSQMWWSFVGAIPDGEPGAGNAFSATCPDNVVVIYDRPGKKDGRYMRGLVLDRPGFMVRVRSSDYRLGWEQLRIIAAYFDSVVRVSVAIESLITDSSDSGLTDDQGNSLSGSDTFNIPCITRGQMIPMGLEPGTKRRWHFSLNADCVCDVAGVTV